MNQLEIFKSEEFGEIRTVTIGNEPWFVGKDISHALGYSDLRKAVTMHVDDDDKTFCPITDSLGRNQETVIINESGMYSLVMGSKLESSKRFKHWVTSDVLPSIRRTGSYALPMSTSEQIALLAKGTVELEQKVQTVEQEVSSIKNDMPLFGAESDELSSHVRRKGVEILGGKSSEAYRDKSLRKKVYSDMYSQLKREFGLYDEDGRSKSYKALKRKELADAHEFIDCYEPPRYLYEDIINTNVQINLEVGA